MKSQNMFHIHHSQQSVQVSTAVCACEINMTSLKKCFGEETVAAVSTRYILDAC